MMSRLSVSEVSSYFLFELEDSFLSSCC